MAASLLPVLPGGVPVSGLARPTPVVQADPAAAKAFIFASDSENTRKAYASDWSKFTAWCREQQPPRESLPASPETLALYFTGMAKGGYATSSILRAKATISQAHQAKGFATNPTRDIVVRKVLSGIRRTLGDTPVKAKDPIGKTALQRILTAISPRYGTPGHMPTLREVRDRALVLLGFALAARRSELAALQLDDVVQARDETTGLRQIRVRSMKSKTNQTGETRWKVVGEARDPVLCPVRAVESYLGLRGNDPENGSKFFLALSTHGDEFTVGFEPSGRAIARIVKHYAEVAGFDPRKFAGHSLRSGFVTEALSQGLDPLSIMQVTDHASMQTLKGYDKRTGASLKPVTDRLL